MNIKRTLYELMMGEKAYLPKKEKLPLLQPIQTSTYKKKKKLSRKIKQDSDNEPVYFRGISRGKKMKERYESLDRQLQRKK